MLIVMLSTLYMQSGIGSEAWSNYILDEIGVTISLPNDFDVFTRNMPSDSQALLNYGMTSEEVKEMLVSDNLHLDAYSSDGTTEIAVTMMGSSISDFSIWEDNTLNFMVSMWVDELKKVGTIIDEYDIYHSGPVTFVRLWKQAANDPNLFGLQYYTIYNYQAINITMYSYDGQFTATDEELMLDIVGSAVFGESSIVVAYDTPTDTADFQYEILSNGTAMITGYTGIQSSITIPESIDGYVITSIGKLEENCLVTTVVIPSTIQIIEGNPFTDFSGLKAIAVDEDNTSFIADDGVLYSFDKKKLVCYPCQMSNSTFVVPSETEVIGESSFYGNDNLVYIEISEGIEVIEQDAFACADGITDVYFPKTLKHIDGNPFTYSFGLMSVSVDPLNPYFYAQDGVLFNRIEKSLRVFPHNKSIDHYTIPEGIISVGEGAFNNHNGSATITFPKSLQKIGAWAFNSCSGFVFPDLISNLVQIDEFAFDSCDTIESITIYSDATVGKRAFGDCSGLTSVHIEEGVTEISDYMFFACENLHKVELPSTITSIGEHAFRACESLEIMTIPPTVESIGERAFDDCPKLVIRVEEGSYSERYCESNNLRYEYYHPSELTVSRNTYIDPVSGTSFLLPVGWVQKDMPEERAYINAKFVPERDDGTSIIYTCEDFWLAIGETGRLRLERMGYSRKDIDNGLLTAADIADIYSIAAEDVYISTYSNQDFYTAEITRKEELFGFTFSIKITVHVCIRNGYLYGFQFVRPSNNNTYVNPFNEMLTGIVW